MGASSSGGYGFPRSKEVCNLARLGDDSLVKADIQSKYFASRREIETIKQVPSGALDGVTIFRFAHMWRPATSGGGQALRFCRGSNQPQKRIKARGAHDV